jgi:hypothetical protein
MAKQNTLLYVGAAALAFFLFKDKLMGAKTADEESEVMPTDATAPDATVDASAPGSSVSQAINQAKEIAQGFKDVKVLIKTPRGTKDIVLSKGKAKRMARRAARKVKKAKKHSKKSKVYVGPTESSLTPFPVKTSTSVPSYLSPSAAPYTAPTSFFNA